MTWEIVLGIIALVGLIVTVTTPTIKLNSSITKLSCSVDALNENMKRNETRLNSHSESIKNHENRLIRLEEHEKGE